MRLEQVEDDNRHFIVHAQRKRGRVHHAELFHQRLAVGDLLVTFRLRVFLRIAVVDAVHLRRLQNHLRADFIRAQRRRGVRGEIRIARAAAEDDHPPFFQVPDGAAANERLGDLGHRDGALDAGGYAVLFQRVLQGEGVDNSGQHSHVIAGGPFDALLASGQAAENVPSTDDDDDLDAKLAYFADLTGHVVNGFRANTDTRFASQRLATELEQ